MMKIIKLIMMFLLIGVAGMSNAWADGGHVHFGVMIGPYWGPWYYPPTVYYYPYYPQMVVESLAPQVYVEQQQPPVSNTAPATSSAPAVALSTNYWYYCALTKGYYPYVKECSSGWQKVLPQPLGQP